MLTATGASMTQTSETYDTGKGKFETMANATRATSETAKRNCDILLNNFQIKKKRYRVLLNYDHIVWERWDAKPQQQQENYKNPQQNNQNKETDFESEQLSQKTQCGNNINTVHMNEIIRVEQGDTKAASQRVEIPTGATEQINGSPVRSPAEFSGGVGACVTPSAQYLTLHYAERIIKSPNDCNRWRLRSLTLYNADPYIVAQWYLLLRQKLYANPNRLHIRRLLVFINPFGGRKEGLRTYEQHCKPIFQLAGIDASCVVSQRQNQIRDIIMSHDLSPYDAVCAVGGDGTAAEVINGLIFRAMHDRDLIDERQPKFIPKPALPIGIIPAGSTDTIAYSAHGTADPRTAAIHVVLGQRRGCDICSIRNRQGIVRFCASVFSYGYLGDVAAHSEKYRWMGTKRYEYTGVKAFLANRGYEAEISVMEAEEIDSENVEVEARTSQSMAETNESVCYANCQRCSSKNFDEFNIENSVVELANASLNATPSNWTLSTEKSSENDAIDDRTAFKTQNIEGTTLVISKDMTNCDKKIQSDLAEKLPKLKVLGNCDRNTTATVDDVAGISTTTNAPSSSSIASNSNYGMNDKQTLVPTSPTPTSLTQPPKWRTIRGEYFMISCANITCACSRTPNGIARYNHLGDGHFELILVRKTSIFNNLRFALNTMGRSGDIRNLPFVDVIRTRQIRFGAQCSNPNQSEDNNRGSTQPIANAFSDEIADKLVSSWNCDGEVVHDLDVTITSHCQLIDIFMRGPYSYTQSNNTSKKSCCC